MKDIAGQIQKIPRFEAHKKGQKLHPLFVHKIKIKILSVIINTIYVRQMKKSKKNIRDCVLPAVTLVLLGIFVLFGLGITIIGCGNGKGPVEEETGLKITDVTIPPVLDVVPSGDLTLTGKGFAPGDQIRLTSSSDANKQYVVNIKSRSDRNITFTLPVGITSGNYKITLIRSTESLILGSFLLNVVANINIPDVAGKTVKGVVYCNGAGIPDVVISDGYEVTTTDKNGIYYLTSLKKSGYVFISVPGNYEVTNINNAPQFFKRLAGGSIVEQKDFSLIQVNNNKHVVVSMADWHLANRNDDLSQFSSGFTLDINSTISKYQVNGVKVYGLALGDMSWDAYWYENNFALPEYLIQMFRLNCTVFNVMGNHDNDPYSVGDWLAESKFKNIIGPSYYSFNLGNVHYIVLDNIDYLNTDGSQGVIGSRDYNDVIVPDQMAWLIKDLATIKDKNSPIVIAMHIPLNRNPTLDGNGNQLNTLSLNNSSALISSLQSFSKVHVLSGHTHINYSVETSESLMEHNTAAVCATWWWTGKNGYAENHICTDGSPGGYGVWEIEGTDLKWYYKSIGYDKNYQFRSYDMNKVLITAANFAPNATDATVATFAGDYASPNAKNEVLINIWGYDSKWKVEVKEAGTTLTVKRIWVKDPLHIISYEAKRLNVGSAPTSSFVTSTTAHMFKVTASDPASTLEITVTDRFGNVYTETMVRPKTFTYLMK